MIALGDFRYDPESRLLYRDDDEILLPPRVVAVLESLLKRPGKVVPKDDLLASAWEGAFVGEDSLTQAISQLRQALGDDPQRPTYIQTIPRRGYRLIAEVSEPLDAGTGGDSSEPKRPSRYDAPTSAAVPAADTGTLQRGARLGRYEILAAVGAGAMGEVWRATDRELDREVALKLVPADLADDPTAMERFRREARMLAAVDHPNIAAIHTVEEVDGNRFIVMELVEGETLQQRLQDGPLPVKEALDIAVQVARGLEVAHERGIVHRDLKPANVAVTGDGGVKLLDFGLAKEVRPVEGGVDDPTALTATGAALGTAPYMSPEQARGEAVGKQTDIWAFGCLLYEMLTGRRAFEGETVSDTVAAVLKERPDWEALPPSTPFLVRVLLARCLRRDRARRLHDIADARIEIEEAKEGPDAVAPAQARPSDYISGPTRSTTARWLAPVPLALALGALALMFLAISLWLRPSASTTSGKTAFTVELEPGWRLTGGRPRELRQAYGLQRPTLRAMALSPDGRHLVYAATDGEESHLFLRPLEQVGVVRIAGTAGGSSPFFSPDGEWIGFFAGGSLKKVPIGGGQARTILEAPPLPFGAHWGDNDVIVLADGEAGSILTVPATGGEPAARTRVAPEEGEVGHRHPHLLPDGRAVIFTVWRGKAAADIAVKATGAETHEIVIENGSDARLLSSGRLLFAREGTLMAVAFDEERLEIDGEPVRVLEDVLQARYAGNTQIDTGAAQFSVSRTGSLVYATGGVHPELDFPLAWADREGNLKRISTPSGDHIAPRLSPNNRKIAYAKGRPGERDVWIYDLRTDTPIRLTHGLGPVGLAWSPDATEVVVGSSAHGGHLNLYSVPVNGRDEPERLTSTGQHQAPGSWSTNGDIAFVQGTVPDYDIWILPLDGGAEPFLTDPHFEAFPTFSPDGNWLAYASDETGETQVYVTPYPSPGTRVQISREGGVSPAWSSDGRQIFFRGGRPRGSGLDRMMVVDIDYGDHLTSGTPRMLFETPMLGLDFARGYDVALDGRFLINLDVEPEPRPVTRLHVVLNWFEELERLVPAGR